MLPGGKAFVRAARKVFVSFSSKVECGIRVFTVRSPPASASIQKHAADVPVPQNEKLGRPFVREKYHPSGS